MVAIKHVSFIGAKEKEIEGVFTSDITHQIVIKDFEDDSQIDLLPARVAALVNPRMPLIGDEYPDKPLVRCREVGCDSTEDAAVYIYNSKWTDKNSGDGAGTRENPLDDPPEILPVAGEISTTMTRDRDDWAILNYAGDPLPVERTDNVVGFKVKKNVPFIPPWLPSVLNSVNASPISVYDLPIPTEVARFWLPNDWWSLPLWRNNIRYFELKFELHLDFRDQHKAWPLQAGFFQIVDFSAAADGSDLRRAAIVEADGSEPSEPVPLDTDATRLLNPTPVNVHYRETGRYRLSSFSPLPGVVG